MENSASGFIVIHKPSGMPSAAAVAAVRRATGHACGHMGTLDPLASGVLPVAVGNAARLFPYLLNKEKVYRAVFRFGLGSDTLDAEGAVLRTGLRIPSEGEIAAALPSLTGELLQVPPAYSAKNVNGVRAYALARQGKAPELAPARVFVRSFELLGREGEDSFAFRIVCGGGTYVRSLGRDLAAACGTEAVMTALLRERSGPFTLDGAVLPADVTPENWRKFLIPPESAFSLPRLDFDGRDAQRLLWGQRLPFAGEDGEYKLFLCGDLYGIAAAEGGVLRTKVKLV